MIRCFLLIFFIVMLNGCNNNNRKCLKSHSERSCTCVCTNNVGIPIQNQYEVCDKYEE